ncbi:hypothetical protein QAD02_012892 [Eretmocerus hayati]|uniref:Uncharacterized protein n=1 Tax=Eretmocerus hayati TaxID=131215 RepID=A0ACC2P100_9HYME|nr:hypothetical protein QAD02_012892 [Eretmocerus hayati]
MYTMLGISDLLLNMLPDKLLLQFTYSRTDKILEQVKGRRLERLLRSRNLLFSNVPDTNSITTDQAIIIDLLKNIAVVSRYLFTSRIGNLLHNNIRPVVVTFSNNQDLHLVMKNKKKIPGKTIIGFDKTKSQQAQYEEVSARLEARLDDGEKNLTILYIKGTPTIVPTGQPILNQHQNSQSSASNFLQPSIKMFAAYSSKKIIIGCTYIPPLSPPSVYKDHIQAIQHLAAAHQDRELIVLGVLNLPSVNWLNLPNLKYELQLKSKQLKVTDREKSDRYYIEFERLQAKCIRLSRICYKEYIDKIRGNLSRNSKSFWSYVNKLKNFSCVPSNISWNDRIGESSIDNANIFSDYLGSVYKDSNKTCDLVTGHEIDIDLHISSNDVDKVIKRMRDSVSVGHDGTAMQFIKNVTIIYLNP